LPLVLKQRQSSGSRGLVICNNKDQIISIGKPHYVFEKYVEGEEFSVESFIQNNSIQFTNVTQYVQKKHVNLLPANVSTELKSRILELNKIVIHALNIPYGMTHLEVYLTS